MGEGEEALRKLLAFLAIAVFITGCGKVIEEKTQQDIGELPATLGAGVAIPGTSTTTFTLDEDNTGTPADMALVFKRGTSADVQLGWDETNDQFEFDDDLVAEKAFATANIVTFTDEDDTPSVADANVFKTANTANTTITMFDDGKTGQRIEVIIGDDYTTIDFTGTNLKGNDGADWSPDQNDRLSATFDGTDWYCDVGMTTSDAGGDPSGTSSTTFTLDDDNTGSPADMALVFNRGTSADVQLGWDETNDQFEFDDDLVAEKAFATSSIVTFTAQDDTPSVADANIFKTANTSSTTITMFDDGKTGQEILIVINDDYTTIDFSGTNLKGNDNTDWSPGTGDVLFATFDGTDWYCDVGLTVSDVGGGGTGDDIDLTKSDASGGTQTVNLPTAVGKDEDLYIVTKTDSSGNGVVIDPNGSETISGASKYIIRRQYETAAIVSDNSNWWKVAESGTWVDVRDFGATGDGTTDDTTAIQNAITACSTNDVLYFPRGHYYISGELDVTNNLNVIGDGGAAAQIYQSSTSLNLFHFTGAGYFRVENLLLAGEQTTADKCLIRADANASHCIIRNVLMQGGYYGIGLYGVLFPLIEHPQSTTACWHSVSATNQAWIHGERYSGKSINGISIIHPVFQGQTRGVDLYDTNSEGDGAIVSGMIESMASGGKGIYISGFNQGFTIDGVHLEGGNTPIHLASCRHVDVRGVFCDGFIVNSCKNVHVTNSYLYGGLTSDYATIGLRVDGCRWNDTPDIDSRSATVENMEWVGEADSAIHGRGTYLSDRHYRSMCDGDLEAWAGGVPIGFSESPTSATVVEETSTVRFGDKAAKVIVDSGQSTAYLRFPLDTSRYDRTEAYMVLSITVKCWVYKPSTNGFNPKINMDYGGTKTSAPFFTTLNTDEWTPVIQTLRLSTTLSNPVVEIGTTSASAGDYIIVDGVEIVEGETCTPVFDDSRGLEGDFRVGGTMLRSGEVGTMTGNETFVFGDGNIFIKDPGGSNRNLNPSGNFPPLVEITVVNTADASETIYFDTAGLNEGVGQGQRAIFVYDGTSWRKVYKGS